MRKRPENKRRHAPEQGAQTVDESAGQQLTPEEQERASLKRIMSEMGHHGGRKGGRPHGAKRPPGHRRKFSRQGPVAKTKR